MVAKRTINGAQLAFQRKLRGLNQLQLAEAAKVAVRTISRLEKGKVQNVRKVTIHRIARALDASPDTLFDAPTDGTVVSAARHQLNVSLDDATRNSLILVARRYGLKQRDIIAAAPLLFTILAEESLRERSAFADYAELRQGAMAGDYVDAETDSIAERDIFGRRLRLDTDTRDQGNPFASFLTKRLRHVEGKRSVAVSWFVDEPSYSVASEQAEDLVGSDPAVIALVMDGRVALHEMPPETARGSRDERADWVLKKEKERIDSLAALSLEDISFDGVEMRLVREDEFEL